MTVVPDDSRYNLVQSIMKKTGLPMSTVAEVIRQALKEENRRSLLAAMGEKKAPGET